MFVKGWKTGVKQIIVTSLISLYLIVHHGPVPSASAAAQSGTPVPHAAFPVELKDLRIPSNIGKVEDFFQKDPGRLVLLIQDAHAIPQAQRNIRNLTDFFHKTYGVNRIAVEGVSGNLDPLFLRSFPEPKRLKSIFSEYLNLGELTGATMGAVFNELPAQYIGLEDWPLYERGHTLFLQALARHEEALGMLLEIKKDLEKEKIKQYSDALLGVDGEVSSFLRNDKGLIDLLNVLARYRPPPAGGELALMLQQAGRLPSDLEPLERELKHIAEHFKKRLENDSTGPGNRKRIMQFNEKHQAFLSSQLEASAFAHFIKELASETGIAVSFSGDLRLQVQLEQKMREIEGTSFFRNLETYIGEVKEGLFRSSKERALDRESHRLHLLEKLSSLELTRGQWGELKNYARYGDFHAPNGVDLSRDDLERLIPDERLRRFLEPGLRFYQNAETRDEIFAEKILAILKTQRPEGTDNERFSGSVGVIAGGFHAEGLMHRLRSEGISYVLIRPEIEAIPEEIFYKDHMRGLVSWSHYLKVENGKVSTSRAFLRAARDRLLEAYGENRGVILKNWRDQILRELAAQNRLVEAPFYTHYLDEIALAFNSGGDWKLIRKADDFLTGFRDLKVRGEITEENILRLLRPSTLASYMTANQIGNELLAISDTAEGWSFDGGTPGTDVEFKEALVETASSEALVPRAELRAAGSVEALVETLQQDQLPQIMPAEERAGVRTSPALAEAMQSLSLRARAMTWLQQSLLGRLPLAQFLITMAARIIFRVTEGPKFNFNASTYEEYTANLTLLEKHRFEGAFLEELGRAIRGYQESGRWRTHLHDGESGVRRDFYDHRIGITDKTGDPEKPGILSQRGFYDSVRSKDFFIDRIVRPFVLDLKGGELQPIDFDPDSPAYESSLRAARLMKDAAEKILDKFLRGKVAAPHLFDEGYAKSILPQWWNRMLLRILAIFGSQTAEELASAYVFPLTVGALFFLLRDIAGFGEAADAVRNFFRIESAGVVVDVFEIASAVIIVTVFFKWLFTGVLQRKFEQIQGNYYEQMFVHYTMGITPAVFAQHEQEFDERFDQLEENLDLLRTRRGRQDNRTESEKRLDRKMLQSVRKILREGASEKQRYVRFVRSAHALVHSGAAGVNEETAVVAMLSEVAGQNPGYYNFLKAKWTSRKAAADAAWNLVTFGGRLGKRPRILADVFLDLSRIVEIQQHEIYLQELAVLRAREKFAGSRYDEKSNAFENEVMVQRRLLMTSERALYDEYFKNAFLRNIETMLRSSSERRTAVLSYFLGGALSRFRHIRDNLRNERNVNPEYIDRLRVMAHRHWTDMFRHMKGRSPGEKNRARFRLYGFQSRAQLTAIERSLSQAHSEVVAIVRERSEAKMIPASTLPGGPEQPLEGTVRQELRAETSAVYLDLENSIQNLEGKIAGFGLTGLPRLGLHGDQGQTSYYYFIVDPNQQDYWKAEFQKEGDRSLDALFGLRDGSLGLQDIVSPAFSNVSEFFDRLQGTVLFTAQYSGLSVYERKLPEIHLIREVPQAGFRLTDTDAKEDIPVTGVYDPIKQVFSKYKFFFVEGVQDTKKVPGEAVAARLILEAEEVDQILRWTSESTTMLLPDDPARRQAANFFAARILYKKSLEALTELLTSENVRNELRTVDADAQERASLAERINALRMQYRSRVQMLKENASVYLSAKAAPGQTFSEVYSEIITGTVREVLEAYDQTYGIRDQIAFFILGSLARRTAPYGTDVDAFIVSNAANRPNRALIEEITDTLKFVVDAGIDFPISPEMKTRPVYHPTVAEFSRDLGGLNGISLRSFLDTRFHFGNEEVAQQAQAVFRGQEYYDEIMGWVMLDDEESDAGDLFELEDGMENALDRYISRGRSAAALRAYFEQQYGLALTLSQTQKLMKEDITLSDMLETENYPVNYIRDRIETAGSDYSWKKFVPKTDPGGLRTIQMMVYLGRLLSGESDEMWEWDWDKGRFPDLYEAISVESKGRFFSRNDAARLAEASSFYIRLRSALNLASEDASLAPAATDTYDENLEPVLERLLGMNKNDIRAAISRHRRDVLKIAEEVFAEYSAQREELREESEPSVDVEIITAAAAEQLVEYLFRGSQAREQMQSLAGSLIFVAENAELRQLENQVVQAIHAKLGTMSSAYTASISERHLKVWVDMMLRVLHDYEEDSRITLGVEVESGAGSSVVLGYADGFVRVADFLDRLVISGADAGNQQLLEKLSEKSIPVQTVGGNRMETFRDSGLSQGQKVLLVLRKDSPREYRNGLLISFGILDPETLDDTFLQTAETLLQVVSAVVLSRLIENASDLQSPEKVKKLREVLFAALLRHAPDEIHELFESQGVFRFEKGYPVIARSELRALLTSAAFDRLVQASA